MTTELQVTEAGVRIRRLIVTETSSVPPLSVETADLADAAVTPIKLSTNLRTGYINLDITTVRIIDTNAIQNTTEAGVPDGNTAPSLVRVNGATDKALRLSWAAAAVNEVQFAPVSLPPDLDDTEDVLVCLLVDKSANVDTTATIDVQVFFNVGDTECGNATASITETTPTEKQVTVVGSDVPAAPGVMNISLIPSSHASDAVRLYAAWIEYQKQA